MHDFLLLGVLFSFTEMFYDFNLVLKIFVMMTIISFVRNHLGTGPLGLVVIGGFAYFILFSSWWIAFGGVYLLYTLLMFGIASVFIDFFFISSGMTAGDPTKMQSPVSSGADVGMRLRGMQMAQRKPPMGM